MIYKFAFCPYCAHKFTPHSYVAGEFEKYIGAQFERCPKCNRIYQTKKKLYSEMTDKEKKKMQYVFLLDILNSAFAWLIIIAAILAVCLILFKININNNIIILVLLITFIFAILYSYRNCKNNYAHIKEMSIDDLKIYDLEIKELIKYSREKK